MRKLAERVGLSHAFVGAVERGRSPIPPARREELAAAVGLVPWALVELDRDTLLTVERSLVLAGGCDRAVRLVQEMAGGGA